ncbi:hypothetical protein GCM10023259_040550 [Thermocatellispora tengchongensis]
MAAGAEPLAHAGFAVVFIALFELVQANEDLAQKLGPYLGGSGIARLSAKHVSRAYDKLYGPKARPSDPCDEPQGRASAL